MSYTLLAQLLVLALAGVAAATVAVLLQRLGLGMGNREPQTDSPVVSAQ